MFVYIFVLRAMYISICIYVTIPPASCMRASFIVFNVASVFGSNTESCV